LEVSRSFDRNQKNYFIKNKSYQLFKPVFYIIFLCCFSQSFGQENLVPNGSFEEYETCPSIDPPYYFVDRATHWFLPTTGSSDYFNACSYYFDSTLGYYFFSVPDNYNGYQDARSGNGYAGYYAVSVPLNDNYHEYMSIKLKKPLEIGKFYHLTYYVSLADVKNAQPIQFIDHSGALLSNSQINDNNWLRIDENPQVFNEPLVFLNDSTGWQKIEGFFIGAGGEEYLTIGCFSKFEDLSYNFLLGENVYLQAYYYVDDVSLTEIELNVPNVFSPNGDGINDLAFQTDAFADFRVEILNRWGNLVFTAEEGKGWGGADTSGHQLNEGVYFFEVKDKKNNVIKTGFIHLIR